LYYADCWVDFGRIVLEAEEILERFGLVEDDVEVMCPGGCLPPSALRSV
jgi:hypothetical protein